MWGGKSYAAYKLNYWVVFLLILILVLLIYQHSHYFLRIVVSQETRFRTVSFMEFSTENYDIKYTEHDQAYAPMVAETAEASYKLVSEFFDHQVNRKTTVVIYPDNESLAKSFGWDRNETAMGVYWGGTIRLLSPELYLKKSRNMSKDFFYEGPMVHELAHLMVDDLTKGNYNRWWTEGVAQYVEREITGFQFANPFAQGRPLEYYTLEVLEKTFDQLDQKIAYWESLKIVEYIVDNYGLNSVFEIIDKLSHNKKIAQAIEEVTGIGYNEFQEEFYQKVKDYGREV